MAKQPQPTRVNDQVALNVPSAWHHADFDRNNNMPELKNWLRSFNDPLLNDLIERTLTANHDLRIEIARIREANAMVTFAESALYPSIDLSASGGREKGIDRIVGIPGKQGIEQKRKQLRALYAFYRAALSNDADTASQQTLLHSTENVLPMLTMQSKFFTELVST